MKTNIKNSLKNFVSNSVFVFIPMGIFYLFLLIGIVFFVSGFYSALVETLTGLNGLVESAQNPAGSVNEFLAYLLGELKGTDEGEFFGKILDAEWIRGVLSGFFGNSGGTGGGFEEEFFAIVEEFTGKASGYFTVMLLLWSLGIVLANYATGFAVRRRNAKRGVKKFLIAHTLVPIVQSLILLGAVFLLSILSLYGLFLFAAILILCSGMALTNAWLIQRDGSLRLKEILTPQNIFSHIAVTLIILLFDFAAALLLWLINSYLAILIMIPVFIYSIKILDVNAEFFICSLLKERENLPKAETESIETE